MPKEYNRPGGISRRQVIKLMAMSGLLAACRSLEQVATPTAAPTASPTSVPTATPTTAPTATPTSVPTATPTSVPTATPTTAPTVTPTRPPLPEVIKFHPDAPSKVVRTRHAGVWSGDELVPSALRQMLDASITKLTGVGDVREAWAAMFKPHERVAIKVNTIDTSSYWTRVPLVMLVTERLQEIGVPPEQIIIYDITTYELEGAGFPVNKDGDGIRCYGTDGDLTPGWTLMDTDIQFSDILLSCDAVINMPLLKQHDYSGITFAMKNHYGSIDKPSHFHGRRVRRAIAELNAMPPVRDRARLVIGDALSVVRPRWSTAIPGDSILVSFDPVAHDTIGLQLYSEAIPGAKSAAEDKAALWLANGAKFGAGTNDKSKIKLVEVKLG